MSHLIVTGASGYLGQEILKATAGFSEFKSILALSRRPDRQQAGPVVGGVPIRWLQYALPEKLPAEIGPEQASGAALIHCGYDLNPTGSRDSYDANVVGAKALFESAWDRGVRAFVFVSSVSGKPNAQSLYGRSKWEIEQWLRSEFTPRVAKSGGSVATVRPSLILCPFERLGESVSAPRGMYPRMVSQVRNFPVIPLPGGGRQPMSTVRIEDAASAALAAAARKLTGTFNTVWDAPEFTLGDLERAIAKRLALRRLFLPLPSGLMLGGLAVANPIARILGLRLPLNRENILGLRALEVEHSQGAWKTLGLRPLAPDLLS